MGTTVGNDAMQLSLGDLDAVQTRASESRSAAWPCEEEGGDGGEWEEGGWRRNVEVEVAIAGRLVLRCRLPIMGNFLWSREGVARLTF